MSQVLGQENIDCLENLFEEMKGQPPSVNKKRYRADHETQIETLNYLENSAQLIATETIGTEQFYRLRPYALPLIKTKRGKNLLALMQAIYQKFPALYKERLEAPITREELLKTAEAPTENILEGLYYFRGTHDVLGGWEVQFPYKENSNIRLSEGVLIRKDFLEILTDYYRWNFLKDGNSNTNKETTIPEIKVEDKKTGRPSLKKKIIAAYIELKKREKIEYSQKLKSHTKLIQETVQALFPEIKSTKGMEYEAIRRAVGDLFHADKKTSKLASKL
jgi:hypothetical protein